GIRNRRRRQVVEAAFEPDSAAACAIACNDVTPSVTGEIAASQIDSILARSAQEETGARFAAIARILVVVETRQDIVYWKLGSQAAADFFHHLTLLGSTCDVRLISDHQKEKFPFLQTCQCSGRVGDNLDFGRRGRRIRFSVSDNRFVEHSVAIQKYSLP